MNPLKRLGCRRASVLGLLAATVLATPGTATGAPGTTRATGASDTVRASTLGAQAAQSGRYFGTAVAAGRLATVRTPASLAVSSTRSRPRTR